MKDHAQPRDLDGNPVRPGLPMAMLAEITHRCPLACPYCSNPVELTRAQAELPAEDWARVFREHFAAWDFADAGLAPGRPEIQEDQPTRGQICQTNLIAPWEVQLHLSDRIWKRSIDLLGSNARHQAASASQGTTGVYRLP